MSLLFHNLRLLYRSSGAYLDSQQGRRIAWKCVGYGIGAIYAVKASLASFGAIPLVDYCYVLGGDDGHPVPLPRELEDLAEAELFASDMLIPTSQKKIYLRTKESIAEFYISRSGVTTATGYPFLYVGTFIGLPLSFTASNEQEMEDITRRIYVGDIGSIPDDHPAFRDLVSSLMLSDNAKRFAIQQSLQHSKRFVNALFDGTCLFSLLATSASLCYGFNNLFELHRRKLRSVRVAGYLLAFGSALTVYTAVRDSANAKHTYIADKDTCLLGEEYMHGGIEYLYKLSQRNRALYNLGAHRDFLPDGEFSWRRRLFATAPVHIGSRLARIQAELAAFTLDPDRYSEGRESFWGRESLEAEYRESWARDQPDQHPDTLLGLLKRAWHNYEGRDIR